MRYALLMIIAASMLLLAACGGDDGDDGPPQNDPAANVPIEDVGGLPTETDAAGPVSTAVLFNDEGTPLAPEEVTPGPTPGAPNPQTTALAPPVGVLGGAVETEEADADPEGPDTRTGFDYLVFIQEGGPTDLYLQIEVYSDGRVIRDGAETRASAPDIAAIAGMLDAMDFFGMQNTFLSGTGLQEGDYRYRLAVVQGTRERAISAQDGYMPPELIEVLSAIRALTENAPG